MKIANLSILDRVFTAKGRRLSKLARQYMPGAKGLVYRQNAKTGVDIVEFSRPKTNYGCAVKAKIALKQDKSATVTTLHTGDWQNFSIAQNCESFIVRHINPKGKIESKSNSFTNYFTAPNGEKVLLEKTVTENGTLKYKKTSDENIATYKDSPYYKAKVKIEKLSGNIWAELNKSGNFRREHGLQTAYDFRPANGVAVKG